MSVLSKINKIQTDYEEATNHHSVSVIKDSSDTMIKILSTRWGQHCGIAG